MIQTQEDVVSAALALPAEVRAELAERLLSSLDDAGQDAIDAAWAEESERRIEQLDRGEVKFIPGDVLMTELQNRCK